MVDFIDSLREAVPLEEWKRSHCKLCGRRLRIWEDFGQGGYCGYCAPWDYGTGGAGSAEEREKKMADVWRITVGDKVQESESFTPLMNQIQKLVNRRVPFKVGFGKTVEAEVLPGTEVPLGAPPEVLEDEIF